MMPDCDNNKIILIDTSFYVSIFRGLCHHIMEMGLPENKRAPSLLEFAKRFFETISKCCARDNKIYCPECVYNNEIDPENQGSTISWEKGNLPWRDIFQQKDEKFFSELGRILNKHIEVPTTPFESLSREEVDIYGHEDGAIFWLAREKNIACRQNIILLTDDTGMRDHIMKLNLSEVTPMGSSLFLSTYFICCKLHEREYQDFNRSFVDNWIKRVTTATYSSESHPIHMRKVIKAIGSFSEGIKRKKERLESREEVPIQIADIENKFVKREGRKNG